MPKKAAEFLRTTSIAGFLNAEWKEFWYKSLERGSKDKPGLIDRVASECVEFVKQSPSKEEWKTLIKQASGIEEADRISKESTDFGKAVHSIPEAFLLGQPEPDKITFKDKYGSLTRPLTERELFCGRLLVEWCKQTKVKPIVVNGITAVELPLESQELKITGHPDLICTFGDDPTVWVVDWKTSKEFRLDYILQLAFYSIQLKEKYGVVANHGVIIRTPSDPNVEKQFEAHPINNLDQFYELAEEAVNVVNFFKKRGKWKEILKGV